MFLLYKQSNELFENNLMIRDFIFNQIDIYSPIYSINNIIKENISKTINDNYFEIKDYDKNGNVLPNNIFSKFLSIRKILNNNTAEDYTHFRVEQKIKISFKKKIDNFLEIQFNSTTNNSILKFTINSIDLKNEKINIEQTINSNAIIKPMPINNTNNQYIYSIEFTNITMKKNNKISNIFYITISNFVSASSRNGQTFTINLPDGLENHFCSNLGNINVYTNPTTLRNSKTPLISVNPITIENSIVADIYMDKLPAKIKSMRTKQFEKVAETYNKGKIYRAISSDPNFVPLGDYVFSSNNFLLKDALLIDKNSEYVMFAENIGYAWDDDFINLTNAKRYPSSGTRSDPLFLLNLHPSKKDNNNYLPFGDYAYIDKERKINNTTLNEFRKTKTDKNKNNYNFQTKITSTVSLPYLLLREECLDNITNIYQIWSDRSAATPNSVDGSGWTYWLNNNKTNGNGGNNLAIYNAGKKSDNNFIAHFGIQRNYKIKDEFINPINRPAITNEKIIEMNDNIINELKTMPITNVINPSNETQIKTKLNTINTKKTTSETDYLTNLNFNKEMAKRQNDYKHNFLYVNEINTQLSEIRKKEKDFVNNQIKNKLTNNKNDVQKNITSQTNKFKNYDNTISKSSIDIGNQINEYVKLRKFRELLPDTQQVMF